MKIADKIERAFGGRQMPLNLVEAANLSHPDSDVEGRCGSVDVTGTNSSGRIGRSTALPSTSSFQTRLFITCPA